MNKVCKWPTDESRDSGVYINVLAIRIIAWLRVNAFEIRCIEIINWIVYFQTHSLSVRLLVFIQVPNTQHVYN